MTRGKFVEVISLANIKEKIEIASLVGKMDGADDLIPKLMALDNLRGKKRVKDVINNYKINISTEINLLLKEIKKQWPSTLEQQHLKMQ